MEYFLLIFHLTCNFVKKKQRRIKLLLYHEYKGYGEADSKCPFCRRLVISIKSISIRLNLFINTPCTIRSTVSLVT